MTYVLVAEDDPYIQLLITRKLQGAGFDVRATSNGLEALNMAITDTPAIVLLDVMLPDSNGLEICRDIKAKLGAKSPPVIIVSARGQNSDVNAATAMGADDYLIKPFAPNDLLAHVKALLRT
jgi:DNA-binding response OmpR family regulator